ncbi:MAG: hypothetical protein MN733_14600 [Nitrososphaera sp.]|nr:hypothetical protein [Nitrososphaera sp.]
MTNNTIRVILEMDVPVEWADYVRLNQAGEAFPVFSEPDEAEAKAAREEAVERQKAAQIAAWVKEHGSKSQKERYAAGLFDRDEAVQALKEEAFEPLTEWERYDGLMGPDVRSTCTSHCRCSVDDLTCDVTFKSFDAPTCSDAEWAIMSAMSDTLLRYYKPEDFTITLRVHRGTCDDVDCDDTVGEGAMSSRSVLVTLRIGGFTFNRNFSLLSSATVDE